MRKNTVYNSDPPTMRITDDGERDAIAIHLEQNTK
jgi:hypothetical protein